MIWVGLKLWLAAAGGVRFIHAHSEKANEEFLIRAGFAAG